MNAENSPQTTPKEVAAAQEPGRIGDGGGLYLSISADGRKRWVFLYTLAGKQREMGLGSAIKDGVTLAKAREAAAAARQLLQRDGIRSRRDASLSERGWPSRCSKAY